ncbi:hypothetical protein KKC36_03495 [Patescibacteria group bacterium]|nr:hypothetical protein [Patescibacteria group bacterium]
MKKEMEDKDNLQPYGLSQKDLLKAITFVDKNVESKSFAQGLKENFEGLQAWASSSKLSQKAKKALLTCTVASMLLSSCKQVIPTIDIQTEPIPIVETAVFTETAEPTPVPTLFPKLKVTETSPNAGGSYSEEQLTVIDSEGFKEKVSVINNWWSYWGNAAENQRPFHPKSENVHIVPFFEEENPESYSLAIEAKMDDGNWHTFLLPIDISKSEFRQYPPVEFGPNGIPLKTGYDIPEGFGPLEVTGDIKWTESFGWVRFDESGEMVEAINMETGQWEEMSVGYDFSSSLNPEKIPTLEKWFSTQPSDSLIYMSEIGDSSSFVIMKGFTLSYELVDEGSGGLLYANLLYRNGMIRVEIDTLVYEQPGDPYQWPTFEINKLTPEEALQISDYFNDGFYQINNDLENEFTKFWDNRIVLIATDSSRENSHKLTSQELLNMFNNALIPIGNNLSEDLTKLESMNVFSSSPEQGFVIILQLVNRSGMDVFN